MKRFILLGLSLISLKTSASILPPNNLTIPIDNKNEGLTSEEFNSAIDKVFKIYGPVIKRSSKKILINRLWEDPRVNAGTYINDKTLVFNFYGGYARHPLITQDALALVVCHEIGHHLGGIPRKFFGTSIGWPSTEGQSDYFATLKCLRKVFKSDDNTRIVSQMKIPATINEKCNIFPRAWEKSLCKRTTMAGLITASISADVIKYEMPNVDTPDETVVEKTIEHHPLPQCRFDTYFQGSICEVSSGRSLSTTSEVKGTCHAKLGLKEGLRPSCWFKGQK